MVVLGILTYCFKGLFGHFGSGYCLHLRGESLVQTDAEVIDETKNQRANYGRKFAHFVWLIFPFITHLNHPADGRSTFLVVAEQSLLHGVKTSETSVI